MIFTDERVEGWDYPSSTAADLAAVRHNLGVLHVAAPGTFQLATVKANAYGHGLLPVAYVALDGSTDWPGVAQLVEAFTLRRSLDEAGVARADVPILAWVSALSSDFVAMIEADIDLPISWTWVPADICAVARGAGRPVRVHVRIDTGMLRTGFTLAGLPALASALRTVADDGLVDVVGAWSHVPRADNPSKAGNASTVSHIRIFKEGLTTLADTGITPCIQHLSATSDILWHHEAHYDMVRAGIDLHGLSPGPEVATSEQLGPTPTLELRTSLISIKVIEERAPASYDGTRIAPTRRWIGLAPLSHGDDILRAVSSQARVIVHTTSDPFNAPLIGRVCMDQFMVGLGPAEGNPGASTARSRQAPAIPDDIATLFGSGVSGEALVNDWAQVAGTINYEIVTHLGVYISHIYRDGVNATSGSNS